MTLRDILNFILDFNLLWLIGIFLGICAFLWLAGFVHDFWDLVIYPKLPARFKNFIKALGIAGYFIGLLLFAILLIMTSIFLEWFERTLNLLERFFS